MDKADLSTLKPGELPPDLASAIAKAKEKYSYIIPSRVKRKIEKAGLNPYDPKFTKLRSVILRPGTIINHSKGQYRVHIDGSYRHYYGEKTDSTKLGVT